MGKIGHKNHGSFKGIGSKALRASKVGFKYAEKVAPVVALAQPELAPEIGAMEAVAEGYRQFRGRKHHR